MRLTLYSSLILLIFIVFLAGCKKNSTQPLARGPVWLVFTKTATQNLIDDNVHTIHVSNEGKVWFGTDSGAVSYLSGVWSVIRDSLTYYTYDNGNTYKRQTVMAIAEGKLNTIWFGLDGGGVRRFNRYNPQRAWQRYSPDEPDPINRIQSYFIRGIVADKFRNGDVWVATLSGVNHYVPSSAIDGTWYPYSDYSDHFASSLTRSVTMNPSNGWTFFGTHDGVPYVYDDNGLVWGRYTLGGIDNYPIHSIAVDYSNTVWMGKTFGVTSWNPGTTIQHHYLSGNTNNQLPNDLVNAVAVDYFHSTRWFGTNSGLTRMQDTTWTLFNQTTTPELPSNKIQALSYDNKGNLWIGTDIGIVAYNPGGFQY
jgi:ligand-binding sensor domain-containing protein